MFQIQTPFKEKLKAKTLHLPPKNGSISFKYRSFREEKIEKRKRDGVRI
jgi:hypothetical protein